MENIKIIFQKYKYLIILISIICTIIVVIVYNQINNDTNDEFIELKNENINETNEVKEISKKKIRVHISGEVNNPGVIEIDEESRIIDAVNMAGGLTEEADITNINLAYVLEDAMKINIPNINDEQEKIFESEEIVKVNINTATAEQLQGLEGIGNSTALKIIAYRKENGKFNSIDELKNITGIGESKFERIKEYIYVK